MFENCHLRIGDAPFRSCMPLTAQLLGSLYALPVVSEKPLREALEALGDDVPWAESFAVAPDQTAGAVAAMLRQLMLATRDLEPRSIVTDALPSEGRARSHLEALRDLWTAHPGIVPADIAMLKAFLTSDAAAALQPMEVIWDRHSAHLTPLERAVLEHLEHHHGQVSDDDSDFVRLISAAKVCRAPETGLAGHVQRHLPDPGAPTMALDDTLAVLSVRDALTECEAAAAIVQRWLADDPSLTPSEVGIILPEAAEYGSYLSEAFGRAGLVASSLPAPPQRRNIGAEALLHFLQCRRRPAPAMALASLYCSPVLCWHPEVGAALATAVMKGDFQPRLASGLTGRQAALFSLIRSAPSSSNAQLKEQIRAFQNLLSDDTAVAEEVSEAKALAARIIAALGNANDAADAELEKAIQIAAGYQASTTSRGAYFLGGISVIMAHETPRRPFRKLLVLGFNDGSYPFPPSGNPFFLDSEASSIAEGCGIRLPSQESCWTNMMTELSIVPAGAGAGKTHHIQETLTQWVREEKVRPEKILAVTFTEAAAGELRQRIRGALIADGNLKAALAVDRAYVSTIHGLGRRLLIEHAFASGSSPQQRLIAEDEQDLLIRRSIEENPALTELSRNLGAYGYRGNFNSDDTVEDIFRKTLLDVIALLRTLGPRGGDPAMADFVEASIRKGYGKPVGTSEALTANLQSAVTALLDAFPRSLADEAGSPSAKAAFRENFRALKQAQQLSVSKSQDWRLWQKLRGLRLSKPDGCRTPPAPR